MEVPRQNLFSIAAYVKFSTTTT